MDRARLFSMLLFFFLPLGGLELRLVHLQLLRSDAYAGRYGGKASLNLALPHRGSVRDRNGQVLATDERTFDLLIVLEDFEKSATARPALESLLGANLHDALEEAYRRIETQMNLRPERERPIVYRRERRQPYLVRRSLPFEQAYAVEINPERYSGCIVRESVRRTYPFGRTAAAVIGYVGRMNDAPPAPGKPSEYERLLKSGELTAGFEEIIGEDGVAQLARRGFLLDELVGRAGVERSMNDRLRGKAGIYILDRDPETGARVAVELKPSEPGEDLELTIDIAMQKDVEMILAEAKDGLNEPVRAHAVVMDPTTGEILVMASNADFDPNDFIPPAKSAAVEATLKDPSQPLLLHAVANRFQAGSIFKIVTATAGLEEKAIAPSTCFNCAGAYSPKYSKFNCWTVSSKQPPHGDVDVSGALQHSCNCFFFGTSETLSFGALSAWAERFGYGRPTGIDLPGESSGILPRPDRYPRWLVTDTFNLSVGQGDLMVTPVQVARATGVIATGGTIVRPHVLKGADAAAEKIAISPGTLAAVRRGLHACTHDAGGTAYDTDLKRYHAAGKTGSAQRADRNHPHAWFAGYLPEDKPKYVIVVLCEAAHGGGGHVAAPVAARIAERLSR